MPRTQVHEASTWRLDILDKDGGVDEALAPDLSPEQLQRLYRNMVWMRSFDDKALKLQRQGRMGTWAPLRGQEASQAGLALAMTKADWLVPSFREHGIMLARGIPGHLLYAYWRGDERGGSFPAEWRTLPPSVPIASQLIHGAGLGYALKRRGTDGVAVACGGDGSTSEGDFHEALNFAAVFGSRTVFFVQNNGFAISLPRKRQTAAETLAQKADAYGMTGIQVDGNDVLAVYAATAEMIAGIRAGAGPGLIEAVTYRMGDHTTADEASRYRTAEETEYWSQRDPIVRMGLMLRARGLWDDSLEGDWQAEVKRLIERDLAALEAMPAQPPEAIFDNMYAELTPALAEQRRDLIEEVAP